MIFSCGETWEARKERQENWHDCFLIFPTKVDERDGKDVCAWLQVVERRRYLIHPICGYGWEYRLKPAKSDAAPDIGSEEKP
jgi:hypothetical protein